MEASNKYESCLIDEDLPYDIITLITEYCTVIEEQITREEFHMIDYSCIGIIYDLSYDLLALYYHNKKLVRDEISWDIVEKELIGKFNFTLSTQYDICIMLYSESKYPNELYDISCTMEYTHMKYYIPKKTPLRRKLLW